MSTESVIPASARSDKERSDPRAASRLPKTDKKRKTKTITKKRKKEEKEIRETPGKNESRWPRETIETRQSRGASNLYLFIGIYSYAMRITRVSHYRRYTLSLPPQLRSPC